MLSAKSRRPPCTILLAPPRYRPVAQWIQGSAVGRDAETGERGGAPDVHGAGAADGVRWAASGLLRYGRRWWPLISFCSGIASFLLVRRQHWMGGVVNVLLFVVWMALLFERPLDALTRRLTGRCLPKKLIPFITQMVHQESFCFVLPFFLVTTVWSTGQLFFTGALCAAALVSVTDPVYFDSLAPRRWLYFAYHCLAVFVVALTVLPLLLHLSTGEAYALASMAVAVVALPGLSALLGVRRGAIPISLAVAFLLANALWLARGWVPPATLWVTRSTAALAVDGSRREPLEAVRRLSAARLRRGGLYVYTAIHAPRGLAERVYHVWKFGGRVVDRIPLKITGGRASGYRAWSHKRVFPKSPAGLWNVDVVTADGQLIGTVHFRVVSG